jgi:hypothetical protein
MHTIRRTAVAALAAATLSIAPLSVAEAAVHAKPAGSHSSHGGKGGGASHHLSAQTRGVLRQVTVRDRALARVAASRAITGLADEQESVLTASIAQDRADLAALKDAVSAGTTKPRAAKAALRAVRVENYLRAVAVLRDAAELADAAVDLPEVLDLVDAVVAGVLEVSATGGRTVLRTARADLEDAWALYDELTAEPEECTADETDDCTDDGTGDGTEDGTGGSDDGGDTPEVEPLG